MKKKKLLSIFLSVAVAVTMCLGTTSMIFAGEQVGADTQVNTSVALADESLVPSSDHFTLKNEGRTKLKAGVTVPLNSRGETAYYAPQFSINIPSNGYLIITALNANNGGGESIKTTGFSSSQYCNLDYVRAIGVKKGQYTFSINNGGDPYYVLSQFTSVKESKYGTKKKKAKKIKKKKVQKGLMITGAQKTHWYKFKNTKRHKAVVTLRTTITDTGTALGGVKMTLYKGKKKVKSIKAFSNEKNVMESKIIGYNLKKGTYYVKIEPYKKATGYFTLKWK